jgi:hypothetical protein
LVARASAGLEIHLPGAPSQTIQFLTKTVERELRIRCGQNFLKREEVRVHPGHGTRQPWDIGTLVRACAVRGTAAGKPADIPGADAQHGRIGGDHASTACHDLLAPLGGFAQ